MPRTVVAFLLCCPLADASHHILIFGGNSMIHFHSLRVKKIQRETDDCVSIEFDVPRELREIFQFQQGQSLTVRRIIGGEEVRRTYSICSAPFENLLRVAVKKVPGGVFSTFANDELGAGDEIDVMPPVGKFYTELNLSQKKHYVAFAAGSGITPVLSIIKTTLHTEPESEFTLIYGNRTKNSIIFKEELEALKDKFLRRFTIVHILSREKTETEINHGRIDVAKLDLLFSKLINVGSCDEFFLCVPEEMIFCVKGYLEGQGVPASKIHFELFTIPGEKHSGKKEGRTDETDADPKSKVAVKLDGVMFEFDLGYESESILDAALRQGADLPYACKGGSLYYLQGKAHGRGGKNGCKLGTRTR